MGCAGREEIVQEDVPVEFGPGRRWLPRVGGPGTGGTGGGSWEGVQGRSFSGMVGRRWPRGRSWPGVGVPEGRPRGGGCAVGGGSPGRQRLAAVVLPGDGHTQPVQSCPQSCLLSCLPQHSPDR